MLPEHADLILRSEQSADFFDNLAKELDNAKMASNFMVNQLLPYLDELEITIDRCPIRLAVIVEYLELIRDEKVSHSVGNQRLWPKIKSDPSVSPIDVANDLGILMNSNESYILGIIDDVIAQNQPQVIQYKKGKKALIGFFMGKVMKASQGSADPQKLKSLLERTLSN